MPRIPGLGELGWAIEHDGSNRHGYPLVQRVLGGAHQFAFRIIPDISVNLHVDTTEEWCNLRHGQGRVQFTVETKWDGFSETRVLVDLQPILFRGRVARFLVEVGASYEFCSATAQMISNWFGYSGVVIDIHLTEKLSMVPDKYLRLLARRMSQLLKKIEEEDLEEEKEAQDANVSC